MRLDYNLLKIERENSKCRQIKPYSDFKNILDHLHIKRYIYKTYEIILGAHLLQMKNWIQKIYAIRFVTNNLNRYQFCKGVRIIDLLMLDFHYLNLELSFELAR